MASSSENSSKVRKSYFESLEKWLNEARIWNEMNLSFAMHLLTLNNAIPSLLSNNSSNINQRPFETSFNQIRANILNNVQNAQLQNIPIRRIDDQRLTIQATGNEFAIPPLWKRFVAEFIDFVILFFLKLAITFIAIDLFDFIDLDKYDIGVIQNSLKVDYKKALEMTSDILVLEFIHKVVVCGFEAYWIQGGNGDREGGRTPGKMVMALRVVTANNVVAIPGRQRETVVVYPGTGCNFWTALTRSILKNVILALFFPVCFTLFFFQFNRTGYDIICNTIVVEDNQYPVRRRNL